MPKDSCNQTFCAEQTEKTHMPYFPVAFPDSGKFSFMFADVNNDNKLDGLVTFNPKCCNCSGSDFVSQSRVILLSNKETYDVNDTFFNDIKPEFTDREYYLDEILGINEHGFFGTMEVQTSEVDPKDVRSPMHTHRMPIEITFPARKLIFLDLNRGFEDILDSIK